MPSQPLGIGLQTTGAGKIEFFAVVLDEISADWRRLFEVTMRDPHQEIAILDIDCPESTVKHPVCIGRERETVPRVVVSAFGMPVDVCGLDQIFLRGIRR